MKQNVETFIGCDADYAAARIVLFGAPFDSTTSFRPGARFGSAAIRHESFGLETYSPYQDKDLEDISVFDCGDLELCFGSAESALADIEKTAAQIVNDNKLPLLSELPPAVQPDQPKNYTLFPRLFLPLSLFSLGVFLHVSSTERCK